MFLLRRTILSPCVLITLGAVALTADTDLHIGTDGGELHERIDRAIADAHVGKLSPVANDVEFLRRIYLHLVGRSPTAEETGAFLAEDATVADREKRSAVIDRLLASDEFCQYYSGVLDVMLMERRGGNRIATAEWKRFLHKAISEKWPYDRIVRTIISADGNGKFRGAAKWLIQREVEPNALTRDIGRIFLGRDLQCAQCHDHPNVGDYEQSEYYGILAFVNRSYLFEDEADNKKSYVGEKAEGDAEYVSVFAPDDDPSKSEPYLLCGLTLDVEPRYDGADAYIVPPTKTAAGVPRFSRRTELARLVTHPANEHFAKNAANRFWAHMMGHGLVDPVDFHHSDNPPSHPELLKSLADHFVASKFDIRELLRQIAKSSAYQRSIDFPAMTPRVDDAVSEQIAVIDSLLTQNNAQNQPSDLVRFQEQLSDRRHAVAAIDAKISQAAADLSSHDSKKTTEAKAASNAQKQLASRRKKHTSLVALANATSNALEALPDDAELNKTHADLQARIDKLAKGVEDLKSKIAAHQKAGESHSVEVDSLKKHLAKLRARRIGLADMVAESRGIVNLLVSQKTRQDIRTIELRQRREALTLQQSYVDQNSVLRKKRDRLTALNASSKRVNVTDRNRLASAIDDATARVVDLQKRVASLQNEQADSQQQINKQQAVLESLQNAVAETRSAAKSLGNLELEETIATLSARRDSVKEQLESAKEAASAASAKLSGVSAELRNHTENRDALLANLSELNDQAMAEAKELDVAQSAVDESAAQVAVVAAELRTMLARRFAVRSLSPLSPEQLAGSTIAALELLPRFQLEAVAEWEKSNKAKQPDKIAAGDEKHEAIRALIQKRVDQVVNTYISLFAAPGGAPQDVFSATADQALFLANDYRVQGWLSPKNGTLLKRIQSCDDPSELANELHLAILSRPATEGEQREVAEYLENSGKERNKAIRELVWGLLSSIEFRFNH